MQRPELPFAPYELTKLEERYSVIEMHSSVNMSES